MLDFIHIDRLTFTYENSIEPLFDEITFQLQRGWTGVVGPNGSGKTTLLKLLTRIIRPDSGTIKYSGKAYYCAQRTDYIPTGFEEFINSNDKQAYRLKDALAIQNCWSERWDSLSHGERKRSQIGTALFLNPTVLAVDEPSNHLDLGSKRILFEALQAYRGIGILVSHDRDLLDDLCRHTLFVQAGKVDIRSCNYSVAVAEIEKESVSRQHDYEITKWEVRHLKRQIVLQKEKVDRTKRRLSKRGLAPRDHDARAKIDGARLTGKDASAGRKYKNLQDRLENKRQKQVAIGFTQSKTLGISFDEIKGHYYPITVEPNKLFLGPKKKLSVPNISIQNGDKIGIMGNNGTGQSTFLNYFVSKVNVPVSGMIYIPQEIPIEQSRALIGRLRDYNDERKGKIASLISRLGSAPAHILETEIPSPGEIRKLMLAEGIIQTPSLIIMDEPTNHMDLSSIQCMEQALIDSHCTLLLVSHDRRFLKKIVDYYWVFRHNQDGNCTIRLEMKLPG